MFTTEMCVCVLFLCGTRARVAVARARRGAPCAEPPQPHLIKVTIFSPMSDTPDPPGVLMLGTGEYTTGFVAGLGASNSINRQASSPL